MQSDNLEQRRALRRDLLATSVPILLVVAVAFGVTLVFVKPAPPMRIVLASAADEGGSRYYARRYQEILKRQGITLEVRETKGSVKNIELLADEDSEVDVAFVQSGGALASEKTTDIVSLGSLAFVPL